MQDFEKNAAAADAEPLTRTRQVRERFDTLSKRIAQVHAGVPVEEGLAEIDAVVTTERNVRQKLHASTSVRYYPVQKEMS